MTHWNRIDTAPEGITLETKIEDAHGVRNVQKLTRKGRLWFYSDMSMYVYYSPTHWRLKEAACLDNHHPSKEAV